MSLMNDIIVQVLADLRDEFAVETFVEVEYGQKFDEPNMDVRIRLGGEDFPDSINKTNMTEFGPLGAPTHEIGGGLWWRRRFQVRTELFIDSDDRDAARLQATDYQTRIIARLTRLSVTSDDPNEAFIQAIPVQSHLNDVGDSPFIWRGRVVFECLTHFRGI